MIRLLVANILKYPYEFDWSVQGLGMLRIYLSDAVRLHIWDSALRVPGVTQIHTHPWDFSSFVVAGIVRQYRYSTVSDPDSTVSDQAVESYMGCKLKCGEDSALVEEPREFFLLEGYLEIYRANQGYDQKANEIHRSLPDDGTVTLVTRMFKPDRDHAMVYWRGRGGWVDAAPRPATRDEIRVVTQRALDIWF